VLRILRKQGFPVDKVYEEDVLGMSPPVRGTKFSDSDSDEFNPVSPYYV
jgi:hypothetical protein